MGTLLHSYVRATRSPQITFGEDLFIVSLSFRVLLCTCLLVFLWCSVYIDVLDFYWYTSGCLSLLSWMLKYKTKLCSVCKIVSIHVFFSNNWAMWHRRAAVNDTEH